MDQAFTRVSDFVAWYAARTPDAEAAVQGDTRLTYAELHRQVESVARALLAAGIRKGDRVATLSPPNADFWITFLASVSIGAIWLGLNPRYRTDELKYLVGDAEPSLLFARTEFGGRRYDDEIAAMRAAAPSITRVVSLGDAAATAEGERLTDFIAAGASVPDESLDAARARCGGREACLLVYTSGSTGQP